MDTALEQHPLLRISNTQIEGAQGELQEQRAYAYNPELSVEPQRRRLNGGGSSNDYYVTLSQGIELGGKQGYRERSAQAALEATKLEFGVNRHRIMVDAARALVALYFSKRELLWRNQQSLTLLQLNKAVSRQMEVGEANQLDVNLAKSSLTQAIHAEALAKQQHAMNVSKYLMATGESSVPNDIQVELPKLLVGWEPLSDPIETAMNSRSEIKAKRQRLAQYSAKSDLAKAQRIPDVTVGITAGRESGDQLYSLGFTVPIPVLNNHNGAYRAAMSQATAQQAELEWLEKRVKLEVQEAIYNHGTAMRAVLAVNEVEKTDVSKDNISLAKAAFDSGELNIEELVVHINQILESRINSAAILQQGWMARIRLAEVLGHPEYILEGNK
nr:TolC family protein [Mariprofundus sp. NF]